MIKKRNVFIFSLLLFISCNQTEKRSIENIVHPTDKECLKEIKEAKSDLANKKLVYCHNAGDLIWQSLRAEKEMASLLRPFHIEYKETSSSDLVIENRIDNCYCNYMQEQINLKFGNKFTDSLLYKADSLYISKHLSETYDYTSWDVGPIYPGDTIYDSGTDGNLQKAFDDKITYNSKEYGPFPYGDLKFLAHIRYSVLIDQSGNPRVLEQELVYWGNKAKERKFKQEVYAKANKIAIELIEQAKWKPAIIKKIKVKSESDITVYFFR